MKICKKCAHCNADEAKFCVKCGERLAEQQMPEPQIEIETLQCVKCGYNNKKGVKFCGNCGNEFKYGKDLKKTKKKRWRKILIAIFVILLICVGQTLWSDGYFEKDYYINAEMNHSAEIDMYGDTISISIDTNADWLNKDNIEILVGKKFTNNWQTSTGNYIDLQGHKYAFDPVSKVRFVDDRHVEVTIDKNRGYNRTFRIVVRDSGWNKNRDEKGGRPHVSGQPFFDLYQKGYEGTYSISK